MQVLVVFLFAKKFELSKIKTGKGPSITTVFKYFSSLPFDTKVYNNFSDIWTIQALYDIIQLIMKETSLL